MLRIAYDFCVKKILYGVSGIGNGHSNRQLPLIEALSKDNQIVILAYQDSLKTLSKHFRDNKNITFVEIDVPFIVGVKEGLSFKNTAENPYNMNKDFTRINALALAKVEQLIGTPDLVISDYEPICAQYAYSKNAPLVTIDQQSKYLYSELPHEINGFTFADEIQRLHMFFPKADARIACSFFRTKAKLEGDAVIFMPPPIKPSVVNTTRKPSNSNQILMYISSAREFVHTPKEVINALETCTNASFNLFIRATELDEYKKALTKNNINLYVHGDPMFMQLISSCDGIISTAGHSLLSEAMYLGIPVYAIPVEPYEQHMNAKAIGDNEFGISNTKLEPEALKHFVKNLSLFANNIKNDKDILIRGNGKDLIVYYLKKHFLSKKKILLFCPPFSGHLNILKELVKETSEQFKYHLVITGWNNIKPDLSGINPDICTVLNSTDLNETDPTLWTFQRAETLLQQCLKITNEYKPDLIIYDFFSVEGNFVGRLTKTPYWCSIPALIGPFDNQEYRDKKFNHVLNKPALELLCSKYKLAINQNDVEMISDGFHLPGQINLVWSFEEVTPTNFRNNRTDSTYVFVGNLRGDNAEKQSYRNVKPMVYISLGTVVMNNLWEQQEDTREALKIFIRELANTWNGNEYQIIFVTQGKDILDKYPENWWVYDSVDQIDVLSRADLFITHGGSNSFHEALMLNVPMLVVPFFGDQILVGATAEYLGVGKKIGGSTTIDTHEKKTFLNKKLAKIIDSETSKILKDFHYTQNYLDLSLSYSPIDTLLNEEIPYDNGDLIVGDKNFIPRTKEQLPIDIDSYIYLLKNKNEIAISGEIQTVLNTLESYIGKSTDVEKKIFEYFACVHSIHCLDPKTNERTNILQNLVNEAWGQINFYEKQSLTWIKKPSDNTSIDQNITCTTIREPKEIILTSQNSIKLKAMESALKRLKLKTKIFQSDPKILVDEQLVGLDNIASAAMQRLNVIRENVNKPTTIVSTVSGIVKRNNKWVDTAIVIACDENGNTAISKSSGLVFLENLVTKTRKRGFNKHTVGSILAEEIANHYVGIDPHSLITSGHLSRTKVLENAIINCLKKLY